MNWNKLRVVGCLVAALAASQAWAAEDEGASLVEKVAVRNRLFKVDGHFELGGNVGLSVLSRLTDTYNFNASGAYNMADWLGVELRVGYAYSRHTSLADMISSNFLAGKPPATINDLSDMWEMTFNSMVGIRFQPIYGKLGLMAELPIHFQLYAWLGGGVGLFNRQSLLLCVQKSTGGCSEFFTESKVGPLVSAALGFRLWVQQFGPRHSIKVELRDYSYLDSYYVNVASANVTPATPTAGGQLSPDAGITNLVQLDLGYAFIF